MCYAPVYTRVKAIRCFSNKLAALCHEGTDMPLYLEHIYREKEKIYREQGWLSFKNTTLASSHLKYTFISTAAACFCETMIKY